MKGAFLPMQKQFNRLGIDKTKLTNVEVIDLSNINYQRIKRGEADKTVSIDYSNNTPLLLADDESITRLVIKDSNRLFELTIECKKNNKTAPYIITGVLELTAYSHQNNLYGLTASQYRVRVSEVIGYINSEYGIKLSVDNATISSIEVNRTFTTKATYDNYSKAINYLLHCVDTEYRTVGTVGKDTTTFYANGDSKKIKVYNKVKQLRDIKGIKLADNLQDEKVMRLEITLTSKKTVAKYLGSNKFCDLKHNIIYKMFTNIFMADLVTPYRAKISANNDRLYTLTNSQMKNTPNRWLKPLLDSCIELNQINDLFVADVGAIKPLLKGCYRNKKQLDKRIYTAKKKFDKYLSWNTTISNINEIITQCTNKS